ncbi:hypothetical protein CHUAL_006744 [Chamberlinius hualienensis]
MGNQKSKDSSPGKTGSNFGNKPSKHKENGSEKLPSYHLPFQKKSKSSAMKRLMNVFNKKRNANKKKIQIKYDDTSSKTNSGLFLGSRNSNNSSYCSPYLLLNDSNNDPLASFWPPLAYSHLSLINRNDADQVSKINMMDDDDDLDEPNVILRKASTFEILEDKNIENMTIHDVYSTYIQQAKMQKVFHKEEPIKQSIVSSSDRSRSRSSSSGGTGEVITCSSGSSAEGNFEDACSSFNDQKDGKTVEILQRIEEVSIDSPITLLETDIDAVIDSQFVDANDMAIAENDQFVCQMDSTQQKNSIKQVDDVITSLQQSISSKQQSSESLQQPVAHLQRSIESLQRPIEGFQQETASLQQSIVSKQPSTGSLNQPVSPLQLPIESFQQPKTSLQQSIASKQPSTESLNQLTSLQKPIASSQQSIASKQPSTESLNQLTSLQKPIASSQQSIASKQPSTGSLNQPVSPLQRSIESLQRPIGGLQQEAASLQQSIVSKQPSTESLKQLTSLQQPITSSQQSLASKQPSTGSLNQPVAPLQLPIESLQRSFESLQQPKTSFQQSIASKQPSTESLKQLTSLQQPITSSQQLIASKQPSTESLKQPVSLLQRPTASSQQSVSSKQPSTESLKQLASLYQPITSSIQNNQSIIDETRIKVDRLVENANIKAKEIAFKHDIETEISPTPEIVITHDAVCSAKDNVGIEDATFIVQTAGEESKQKEAIDNKLPDVFEEFGHVAGNLNESEMVLYDDIADEKYMETANEMEDEHEIQEANNNSDPLNIHLYENVNISEKQDINVNNLATIRYIDESSVKDKSSQFDTGNIYANVSQNLGKFDVKNESSISLSDGDKESSCDGSESSVMDIDDDIWDEDEVVESVSDSAVSIKTKLVMDLLNQSEVDMEDFNAFLNLPCPLEEKYQFLQVQKLFDANQIQDSGNLDELGRCFRVLSRYGLDLLKPVDERPMYWKKILLPSETPTCRWLSVQGAQEILLEFGYRKVENGLIYSEEIEPDKEAIAAWVIELLLAAHELSCFSLQAHPQPDLFKQSLTCSRDNLPEQLQKLDDNQSSLPSASSADYNKVKDPSSPPAPAAAGHLKNSQSLPVFCKNPDEDFYKMNGRSGLASRLNSGKENYPGKKSPPFPTISLQNDVSDMKRNGSNLLSLQRCHLCGSSTPAVRCEKCSNLIFCLSCDDMYHRHPKRRDHVRKLAQRLSYPSPTLLSPSPPPRPPAKSSDSSAPPVAPPRRRRSQLSLPSSPVSQRKNEQAMPELPRKQQSMKFGSLKNIRPSINGRPPAPLPSSQSQPPIDHQFEPSLNLSNPTNRQKNRLRENHSPIRQNCDDWISPPQVDQSSSDIDDEDGRSTRTSSEGRGFSYSIDDQWQRPPTFSHATTVQRRQRYHHPPNLPQHRNSFTAPTLSRPFVDRENSYMNHSSSSSDLSLQQNCGFPLQQVHSMSEGLDYAGSFTAGYPPNWIGPDQYGTWFPPSRSTRHSSYSALYPQPQFSPTHIGPVPWGYQHPYTNYISQFAPTAKGQFPPSPTGQFPPSPSGQFPPSPTRQYPPNESVNEATFEPINNENFEKISPTSSQKSKSSLPKTDEQKSSGKSESLRRNHHKRNSEEKEVKKQYSESNDDGRDQVMIIKKQNSLKKKKSRQHTKENGIKNHVKDDTEKVYEKPVEVKKDEDNDTDLWECEHCTFLNEITVKICDVCCKTRGLRISSEVEQPEQEN